MRAPLECREIELFPTKKARMDALKAVEARLRWHWARLLLYVLLVCAFILPPALLDCAWPGRVLPRGPMTIVVCTIVAVTFASLTTHVLFRKRRAREFRKLLRAQGIPICIHCGYDLRGQTDPRCPECGRAFDAALLAQAPPPPTTQAGPKDAAR
jgi:hypothetical protein